MIFKKKKINPEEWHTVFAWLPRRVNDHEIAWLEFIEQKFDYNQNVRFSRKHLKK